jgi:NAD+ synthase (glutamine-hydrolysing)
VPAIRLALAQIDVTVGDLRGNAAKILEWAGEAAASGADLVVFPEMALTGYPIEDLSLRASFQAASREAIDGLARQLGDSGLAELVVVCGFLDQAADVSERAGVPRGAPQNAAAVLHAGRVVARYAKHHLPNYGVFDEFRYFVPGEAMTVVRVAGVDVALAICEDLWRDGPAVTAKAAGAGLLVVLNGSPYERAKNDARLELCALRATEAGCPLAYVNLVGGQDELVFDGDSLVVGPDGKLVSRAAQFVEQLLDVDLELAAAESPPSEARSPYAGLRVARTVVSDRSAAPHRRQLAAKVAARLSSEAETYQALVLGLRDYAGKNGFTSVVLGLSGGIDSALTAVVAADALGAGNVHAVAMPSRYSSDHSLRDAADLAGRLGLRYTVRPIASMVDSFLADLELSGLAEENLQARVRAVILMGLSNQHGHLVLATGNKSELAVGYSTLYGDAAGGYAPLKDVPKTLVWALARWRNQRDAEPVIPDSSISKPPSAELRPDQLDSDSLPDYALLDKILDDYVELDRGSAELVAAGFDRELVEVVLRMVDAAEYKRRQYPPGPKISPRNFGRDRRLPITNAWREDSSSEES